MSKIEQIRKDLLFTLKNKDYLAKDLLRTFVGEYENQAKNGKSGDELVHEIAKKMIKSAETIGDDKAKQEIEILEQYLPEMASKEEIIEFLRDKDLSLGGRLIGMAKQHFSGNVDPALVKQTIALLELTSGEGE